MRGAGESLFAVVGGVCPLLVVSAVVLPVKGFTLSSGIGNIPYVERFLGVDKLSRNPLCLASQQCRVYSWGSKPYSKYSVQIADRRKLPHIRLEDGFVCSYGNNAAPRKYSLVVDPVGIYYDATQPSRLENILNDLDEDSWKLSDPQFIDRAQRLIKSLTEKDISKYNHRAVQSDQFRDIRDYALVIDQTVGDQSVRLGGMSAGKFADMLKAALREYPLEKVFVKVHPEVLAGRKEGYLPALARSLGVQLISGEIPSQHLAECSSVYVGTSLYGMEALLRGIPVVCFGQPFYSGWGATRDMQSHQRRTAGRSVTEIFVASYLLYARYIDPVSGESCELEDIVDHIEVQADQRERIGSSYTCIGITPWKRKYIDRYLLRSDFGHRHLSIRKWLNTDARDVNSESKKILVWGRKSPQSGLEQSLSEIKVARMEDGFVRSVGLGSNFTAPRSLVFDDLGIYFDATRPSRLEHLLQNYECTGVQKRRAQALIELLITQRISKYVDASAQREDGIANGEYYTGTSAILVIGQVDGDASLRYGCSSEVGSNLELIKAVRKRHPGRVIIYKPHPDVVSGNRSDGIANYDEISMLCDHIETKLPIDVALRHCEAVHTMTSLAGLEALLCGKKVVTYGRPFYAGWGLTHDVCSFDRRSRKRTLQELVYISYIKYPAYLDITSGEFTSVEKTISALIKEREVSRGSMTATGLRKYVNIFHNIKKGLTYAA